MPDDPTGLLIIRAWVEPGSTAPLRARIQITDDISGGIRTLVMSQPGEVEGLVSQWLRDLLNPLNPL